MRCADAAHCAQVIACLTNHTGPLNFVCSKTIDEAEARINFPTESGFTFSSQQSPSVSTAALSSVVMPSVCILPPHDHGQTRRQMFTCSYRIGPHMRTNAASG